jgi:anti-sigma factor RsiW
MLTCSDANTLIVRSMDDDGLSDEARATLRRHMAACERCRDEYETQHDVRRLLALHIEDPLPAGFAERLSARLVQESTQRPVDLERNTPATAAPLRWSEVQSAWRRNTRWHTPAFRLTPVAATLALIVAGATRRPRQHGLDTLAPVAERRVALEAGAGASSSSLAGDGAAPFTSGPTGGLRRLGLLRLQVWRTARQVGLDLATRASAGVRYRRFHL